MRLKRYGRGKIRENLVSLGYLLLTHKENMQHIKYTWEDGSRENVNMTSKSFLKHIPLFKKIRLYDFLTSHLYHPVTTKFARI